MSTDAATLIFKADATQLHQAAVALESVAAKGSDAEKSAEGFVASMQKQAITMGKSTAEVRAYDIAMTKMTATQRQAAINAHQTITAIEKQQDAMRKIEQQSKQLGIAATAGITAVTLLIKSALDFNDKMDEMSERTGISAEKLGGLSYAAAQSGTNINNLAMRLGTLSDKVQNAANGSLSAGASFKAMGISLKDSSGNLKGQEILLGEIADKFAQYKDGTEKAALAAELFGRGGRDLIPLLNKGSAGIEELVQKYKQLGGATDEQSARANAFNDLLETSSVRSRALAGQFVDGLIPALTQIITSWQGASDGGKTFHSIGEGIGKILVWLSEQAQLIVGGFYALGRGIGAVGAAVAAALSGNFSGAKQVMADFIAETNKADAAIKSSILAARQLREETLKSQEDRGYVPDMGKITAPMAAAQKKVKEVREKISEEFRKLMSDYNKFVDLLDEGRDKDAEYLNEVENLKKVFKEFGIAVEEQEIALRRLKETKSVVYRESLKAEKEYQEALNKSNAALAASVEKIVDQIAAEKQRVQTFGLTKSQITELAIVEEQHNITLMNGVEGTEAYIAAAELRIQKLRELQQLQEKAASQEDGKKRAEEEKQAWEDTIKSLNQTSQDFFVQFMSDSGNAFKSAAETLKSTLWAALYKMTLQPFVISIVGAVSGQGGAGGALGQGSSVLSSLGGGGDILSSITSLFTGNSSLSAGLSTFAGNASLAIGMTTELAGTMAALGSAVGMAIPYIGVALAAASALGAFERGGPKSGGFASSGNVSGISNTDDSGRWFTPDDKDKIVQSLVDATSKSYEEMIKRLGGMGGGAGFALGFDTDPQGTASDRLHAGAFMNGQQVFNSELEGTVDEATLELHAKRALLAALQASELPEYLANLLDSVDAASADSAAIDKLLETAQVMKVAVELMGSLGGSLAELSPEHVMGLVEAFGGIQEFAAGFGFIADAFTSDADKQLKAQEELNEAFAKLGYESVPKTHAEFLKLLDGLDLTTEAGRKQYAAITALAPAYVRLNGTMQESIDAAKELAKEEEKLAKERAEEVRQMQDFFNSNFYTEQEQANRLILERTRELNAAQLELGISIPTSVAGFRALVESIDRTTPAGQALYEQLLELAPAIIDIANASEKAATAVQQVAVNLYGLVTDEFSKIMQGIQGLAGFSGGDFGEKLGLIGTGLQGAINKLKLEQASLNTTTQEGMQRYQAIQAILQSLNSELVKNAQQLARYTILEAQYGKGKAEALFQLEQEYIMQQEMLKGNAEALAALAQIFQAKYAEIIAGTSGVGSELARLYQNIRDFLKGLKQSELSPLSPQQKFAEAQKEYLELLAKAQKGDTEALAKLPAAAEAYLKVAKEMFASSTKYSQIFQRVVDALTLLAGPEPTTPGAPDSMASVAAAMPTGSPVTSQADTKALQAEVASLKVQIAALTGAIVAGNAAVAAAVTNSGREVVKEVAGITEGRR